MVQFTILNGKKAGATQVARRFPVRAGRSPACDLQLEEPGVWDEHFEVDLHPDAGFVLETKGEALVTANGQPLQRAVLRNGDLIELGAVKLQFWISEARQRGLRLREAFVWSLIGAVSIGQVVLVYWLVR